MAKIIHADFPLSLPNMHETLSTALADGIFDSVKSVEEAIECFSELRDGRWDEAEWEEACHYFWNNTLEAKAKRNLFDELADDEEDF